MSIENILLQLSENLAQVATRLVEQETKSQETEQKLEEFRREAEQKETQIFDILDQKQDKFVEIDGVSVGVSAKLVSLDAAISTLRWEVIGKPAEGDEPATGIYADIEQNSISEERAAEIVSQIEQINSALEELSGVELEPLPDKEGGTVFPEFPSIMGDGRFSQEEREKLFEKMQEVSLEPPDFYYGALFGYDSDGAAVAHVWKGYPAEDTGINQTTPPPANYIIDLYLVCAFDQIIVSNTTLNDFEVIPNGIFNEHGESEFSLNESEFLALCLEKFSGTDWANAAKENFKAIYVSGPPLIDGTGTVGK